MTTCLTLPEPQLESPAPSGQRSGQAGVAWTALLFVLAVGVPLFVCMPLWWDVLHYDICARKILRGGVLYRDAHDNNLPGMTWMQAGVRAVVGWRPEMLRLADLGILAVVWTMLLRWVPGSGFSRPRMWAAVALAAFYLSTPEICHCQRDGWLLLPATLALVIRDRQLRRLTSGDSAAFGPAVLEGLCWGAAVWIKPFIAIPALACWVMSIVCLWRRTGFRIGPLLRDASGLLAGGLLAGALGLAWLAWTGAWTEFWDTILVWDKEYAIYADKFPRARQLLYWTLYTLPWSLIHLPALVIAVTSVARGIGGRDAETEGRSQALLSAFYLALLIEGIFAQLPHDYVMTTTLFPAIVLFTAEFRPRERPLFGASALLAFTVLAALVSPALQRERITLWNRCCTEGSTPELRQRLVLNDQWGAGNWEDLGRLADFFRGVGVRDGEFACLSGSGNWLYIELNVDPPTRFDVPGVATYFFPGHAEQVRQELERSPIKYIVSDLREPSLPYGPKRELPGDENGLPTDFPKARLATYPWNQKLVYRAGRYVVHRVEGPVTRFWWPSYDPNNDSEGDEDTLSATAAVGQ